MPENCIMSWTATPTINRLSTLDPVLETSGRISEGDTSHSGTDLPLENGEDFDKYYQGSDGHDGDYTETSDASISMHQYDKLLTRLQNVNRTFAASFGFINGVTYRLSGRFATMMTGNTLTFADELIKIREGGRIGDPVFTIALIASYQLGAMIFFAVWYRQTPEWLYQIQLMVHHLQQKTGLREKDKLSGSSRTKILDEEEGRPSDQENQSHHQLKQDLPPAAAEESDEERREAIVIFVCIAVFLFGVLADVLKNHTGCIKEANMGCPGYPDCAASGFYYLCPVAVVTGIVSAGYLTTHKTGVTTNMITGHLGTFVLGWASVLQLR